MANMAKRKMLTKDALLERSKSLKRAVCNLPEMDGSVWVRELSGKSLLVYNERIEKLGSMADIDASTSLELMALLISMTVVNEDGTPMFTEAEAMQLADGSLITMLTLSHKAMEVSGINSEAIAEVTSNLKNAGNSSSTAS